MAAGDWYISYTFSLAFHVHHLVYIAFLVLTVLNVLAFIGMIVLRYTKKEKYNVEKESVTLVDNSPHCSEVI